MEFKFCPQCGTPRQGPFCGGCGFSFGRADGDTSDLPLAVEPQASYTAPPEEIPVAGASEPSFPVPFGLKYAEEFGESVCCWNCGAENSSGECELCGFEKP